MVCSSLCNRRPCCHRYIVQLRHNWFWGLSAFLRFLQSCCLNRTPGRQNAEDHVLLSGKDEHLYRMSVPLDRCDRGPTRRPPPGAGRRGRLCCPYDVKMWMSFLPELQELEGGLQRCTAVSWRCCPAAGMVAGSRRRDVLFGRASQAQACDQVGHGRPILCLAQAIAHG